MNDSLGDRMKAYEELGATHRMMPRLPVIVRLDGKAFHSFTRGLRRPYDERLSKLMVETTKYLMEITNARIGYTQSDEITLILYTSDPKSQMAFDGRRDKLNSVLAANASVAFNRWLPGDLPEKALPNYKGVAVFDARTFTVPSKDEAVNCLIWRELDATRNSIQMAAQSEFSHKRLQDVDCDRLQEMLFQERKINWNDYPAFFKRGTYVQARKVSRPFNAVEMDRLPPKHAARLNPDLVVERRYIATLEIPPLRKVENRVGVVFDGEIPIMFQGTSDAD